MADSGSILRTDVDPNIEIVGGSDVAVYSDRIAAGQKIFNSSLATPSLGNSYDLKILKYVLDNCPEVVNTQVET